MYRHRSVTRMLSALVTAIVTSTLLVVLGFAGIAHADPECQGGVGTHYMQH